MAQQRQKPEIISTSFGYKFFKRSTDKVTLYDGGLLIIEPNAKQKKPVTSKQYTNMGLATIVFNRLYTSELQKYLESLEVCV